MLSRREEERGGLRASREVKAGFPAPEFGVYAIAWKELRERGFSLVSGLLAITLGTAVIVGIATITESSRRAVSLRLDMLGANILVLPAEASIDDYYAADIDAPVFPEAHVERLVTSMIPGVDNLSPKLSRRMQVDGQGVVMTGIIPAREIAAKPFWQSYSVENARFAASCAPKAQKTDGNALAGCAPNKSEGDRVVEEISQDEAWLGSRVAGKLHKAEGDQLTVGGRRLRVTRILPETGTVDDGRIFAHLRTVQRILGTGRVINVIEIMGCCNAISEGLLGKLRNVLPDTKVVTIGHIVGTQIETNRLLARITVVLIILVVAVGAISMGNYMWANVEERRREIGVFIAVGFRPRHIYAIFLSKAVALGAVGGVCGYLLGSAGAAVLGPMLAGIGAPPTPLYLLWSVLLAVGIAVAGTIYPTHRATRIDPAETMQEV